MNLKFTLFFVALFAMPLTSHALVGGPFDGNDYSQAFDNEGIYQTAFRFKNGSGFSQWGNNVDLSQGTSGSKNGTFQNVGSILNRSVVYVNGVVYVGMASGMVDHEAKLVMGYSNGTTNSAALTPEVAPPVVTNANGGLTANATLDSIGTANTEFTAKINCIAPELRYSGTGEITVLNTNATDVAALINDQLNGAGGAIAQILTIVDPNAGPTETAAQMIEFNRQLLAAQLKAVATLRAFTTQVSSADNGFSQKMTVFGARKFFIGRR